MELELFKDLSAEERIEMLDAQADEVTEENYLRPFEQDELRENRKKYVNLNMQLVDIKQQEDEAKAQFKALRDPLKKECDTILANLKQGGVYVKGKLYKIVDQEERAVGMYNEDGILVMQRKAMPNELMNPTIFANMRVADKNGTEG